MTLVSPALDSRRRTHLRLVNADARDAAYICELRGDEARSSNGRCEMLGWRFDPPGDAALRPGDPFTFEFRLRFRDAVETPTFSLIVHRLSALDHTAERTLWP